MTYLPSPLSSLFRSYKLYPVQFIKSQVLSHSNSFISYKHTQTQLSRVSQNSLSQASLANQLLDMLGVFGSSIVSPPDELVAAGSRTPSPKTKATKLVNRFVDSNVDAVSVNVGDQAMLAFTHHNQSAMKPRYSINSLAVDLVSSDIC